MPVRLVPATSGKSIKLDKPVLLVGRSPGCDVILTTSRKVSRTHCLVACVENQVIVRDLGSTNGVWVNGQRIEREGRVRAGDQLSFADVDFHLLNVDAKGNVVERGGADGNGRPKVESNGGPGQRDARKLPRQLEPGQPVPVVIPDESADFLIEESMPRLPRIRLTPDGVGPDDSDHAGTRRASGKDRRRRQDPAHDAKGPESDLRLPDPEDMHLDSRYTNRKERQEVLAQNSDPELHFENAADSDVGMDGAGDPGGIDDDDPLGLDGLDLEDEAEGSDDRLAVGMADSGEFLPDLNGRAADESDGDAIPLGGFDD